MLTAISSLAPWAPLNLKNSMWTVPYPRESQVGTAAGTHLLTGHTDPAPFLVLLWGSCGGGGTWLGLWHAL